MPFLEPGHNSKGMHLPQISVMMPFSSARIMPTVARLLPGSIGDVSAMSETVGMAGAEKCVIVADKGFFPSDSIKKLKNKHLSYIIPLRRNSSIIPEPYHFMNVFLYDGKPAKYWKGENDVYIFDDPVLKSWEEKDFPIRIEENKWNTKNSSMKTGSILGSYIFFQILMRNLKEYTGYASNANMLNMHSMFTRMI